MHEDRGCCFREISLDGNYSSDKDDLLNDFYIPILQKTIEYKRIAGFFSSKSLAIAAKGIKGLLENNGQMELIAGAILTKEDVEAINEGILNPLEVIERSGIKDFDNIEDIIISNHVKALGWLIAKDRLKIKIAIVYDKNNRPMDAEKVEQSAIFHQKVGIMKDKNGDMISFSGSINETAKAWTQNFEEFKVFKGWIETDKERFQSDVDKFEKFWNNQAQGLKVYNIPEAVNQKLIRYAPANFDDIDFTWPLRDKTRKPKVQEIIDIDSNEIAGLDYNFKPALFEDLKKLRWYQKEAIDAWIANNYNGILEMATGSGKTFVGIMSSYCLFREKKNLCVVILVPSKQLVTQWGQEIQKYTDNVILISSSTNVKRVKNSLDDFTFLFNNYQCNHFFIVSTIQSYIKKVHPIIQKINEKNILLIADEAHWLGASETMNSFQKTHFVHTLGLTATPIRYCDDIGTQFLYDFLGKSIYTFSIKQAQQEGFLCKYRYNILFVDLNPNEIQEYIRLSRAIAINYQKDEEKTTLLLNKRAKLIKDANAKYSALEELVKNLKSELKFGLIYTDEDQIQIVQNILKRHDIMVGIFLGKTPDEERKQLITKLQSGTIDAIIAIKCLNEGVDIPPLRLGIFLSSSKNSREFIQRRGRLLRTYHGKGIVNIYDLVVAPDIRNIPFNENERRIHDKILRKELDRVREFNEAALNSYENENIILQRLDILIHGESNDS
ncbi:MAG: type I restriction enzyme EcoKI subunit R [Methanoregula sp. PtaU1.Bin051]|nr:MAG: type I restriction enzyme EcoKI subunit R [Methanoregula sp. PtaU1.Bin051]